jgi:S1-C subfamily serine protease
VSGTLDYVIDAAQACYLLATAGPGGLIPLGTSFAIGGNRVATALHVVGAEAKNVHVVVPRPDISDYQDTTNPEVNTMQAELIAADPIRDLAILEMRQMSASVAYRLSGTDAVRPGQPVTTFGFPHADTGRFVMTQQRTAVGARILMGNHGINSKYLVLNTLLRPGQSGGPVFDDTRNVVAILVGAYVPEGAKGAIMLGNVDPATLHQTTHAVSAEYLQAMIE